MSSAKLANNSDPSSVIFSRKAIMDNRGASYRTEDLMLFRRIFDECLRSLPVDGRTAIHQARMAKPLLDCAATGQRNPLDYRHPR
jgi:hypothetical protein